MRSDFENSIKCSSSYEKLVYQHGERLFIFDDGKYKIAAVQLAWEVFKEQQSKIDELQRRNQMLNYNIKEQGQKLVYQNEVIETQAEKLLCLRDEKAELQKRVDAQTKHIETALVAVKDVHKLAVDEFMEWDVLAEKAPKLCEHMQDLSVAVGELEQALKGGSND